MATSTLVQLLEAGEGVATSNRRQVETFIAAGTIAAGDVVAFDATQTGADRALFVLEAANVATGNPLAVGVALEAAASGEQIRVVISGYVEGVDCTAGTIGAAGVALSAGKTAAGQVDAAAATDLAGCFAVSAEAKGATTANKVAVYVKKQF